jgi:nucleotide-binding universal stress UspA family protein/mannitol/fructose-specific phosphotransferase system IIA component (Ntr-type)
MFASHTLLAYPIAVRLGISRKEPVAVSVGATIITDTLSLLVLAIIADLARGATIGIGFWTTIGLGMVGLILLTWIGIPYLTRWFFKNVTEEGGAQFLFVLFMICGCAYLSHYAKMEPIIGAFLAGAAFNRLIPEHSALMSRVVFAGNSIFIPFFLISVGMLIDARALITHPRSWIVALVMVVTVILSKYFAAFLTAKIFNYKSEARNVMFGLSVVQAAATLAAVLVGYELKVFDETVLNGAIAMIMVTCPLGAWMVAHHGSKLIAAGAESSSGTVIEQRLLVSVVNPASSLKLLDLAFMFRNTSLPGAIFPVTIAPDTDETDEAVAEGEKILAACLMHAASVNIPVEPSVRVDINSADGIIRAAKELRANVVLTGWSGSQTASSMLFGSVKKKLVNTCPSRLYFCYLVKPLNTTRKILFFLPPLTERRCDFGLLVKDIKFLSRQIGAEIHVYTLEKGASNIQSIIESTSPLRPVSFVFCETMTEIRSRLISNIGSDDITIVPAERNNSIFWTPTIAHVSTLLVSKFPDNNLLLCYPPLSSCGASLVSGDNVILNQPMSVHPCEVTFEVPFSSALREMVHSAFGGENDSSRRILELLTASAENYPVGLGSSAVLLHAHCEALENSVLIVGRGGGMGSWKLTNVQSPVRIILSLLSPKTDSPEQHLKRLAWIGRRFSDETVVKGIAEAVSAGEICHFLQNEV